MPANWSTFKNLMKPYIESFVSTGAAHSAKKIADAYEATVQAQASTMFGNVVLKGNRTVLENALKTGIQMNYNTMDKTDERPYRVIALGFVSYWAGAVFNPLPPAPPCVAPTVGVQVMFPGEPLSLAKGIKKSFQIGNAETGINLFMLALQTHMKTISGTYMGLIPSPTGVLPSPPIPWVGIL